MQNKRVDVTLNSNRGLVIVENVPAYICEECQEQVYDEDVSMKLQELISRGFPESNIVRKIVVPVFQLSDEAVQQFPENFE